MQQGLEQAAAPPTILIVDDHVEACRPLARLLTHMGYQGVCVDSGEAALAYGGKDPVKLMLLAVMMPGMDGLEVLRLVRSTPRTAGLPVVMYSAVSDPQFREHALGKGANDYWVKASLDYDEIQRRVAALLA